MSSLTEIKEKQLLWFINCSSSCLVFQTFMGCFKVVFQRQQRCPPVCPKWPGIQCLSVLPQCGIGTIWSDFLCRDFQNEQQQ